jgi:4-diphosphocytidyl-2-C-methyl-D-erythritol kinase
MAGYRTVTLPAFAKVNLTLDVRERLPDGYHLVQTVIQQISLADEVSVRLSDDEGISLECSEPSIPTGSNNLAWRAAEAFFGRLGEVPRVHISLLKRIPAQAGLGGGSSNAAAVLRALNILYGKPFSVRELQPIARSLGSDVSFFLHGGTALVQGIGEQVTPLPTPGVYPLVVAVPPISISTAWAYGRIDAERTAAGLVELPPPRTPAMAHVLQEGRSWLPLLHNDFEEVVMPEFPEVHTVKLYMMSHGALAAVLCGSGSGVMGVYTEEHEAHRVLLQLRRRGNRAWLCRFSWQ